MRPSAGNNEDFYGRIPVFHGFARLMDPALYAPLPEDWIVGVADIVDSTRAIADQRYKAVNMAGAAVIAAVTNALQGREFPFVFGGDGASFAVAPGDLAHARDALAATATWVRDDLDLVMRVALVPVAGIRAQGFDVRVRTGDPGYRTVQYHREYVRPRGRVVERRVVRPRSRVVCRTVVRERVRPSGVVVRTPRQVCERVYVGRRYYR